MIRVVLAEDMNMVRGALVALLALEPDIEVVADISSGELIVPTVVRHRPDVAVLDIDLPVVDGLTAASAVHQAAPATRTLILTNLGRPGTLRRALAAKVGGYILKDAPPHELSNAIRRVARGERVVDSKLALAAWDGGDCPLTGRELDVLRIASGGADVPEIASTLHLSQGTVRNYLTAAASKLQARNRVDAVRLANEAGWL